MHPEITYWAVGGHSLGGMTAAAIADADEQVNGLVLYASYPASRIERTDLKVRLGVRQRGRPGRTGRDRERPRRTCPPSTVFIEVPGAAHSWFGDYGEQPGDNPGSGDRAAAQA